MVVDGRPADSVPHGPISVEVHNWTHGAIDGKLFPVHSETRDLSIKIGEISCLKQGVIWETNARHNMAGTERNLQKWITTGD